MPARQRLRKNKTGGTLSVSHMNVNCRQANSSCAEGRSPTTPHIGVQQHHHVVVPQVLQGSWAVGAGQWDRQGDPTTGPAGGGMGNYCSRSGGVQSCEKLTLHARRRRPGPDLPLEAGRPCTTRGAAAAQQAGAGMRALANQAIGGTGCQGSAMPSTAADAGQICKELHRFCGTISGTHRGWQPETSPRAGLCDTRHGGSGSHAGVHTCIQPACGAEESARHPGKSSVCTASSFVPGVPEAAGRAATRQLCAYCKGRLLLGTGSVHCNRHGLDSHHHSEGAGVGHAEVGRIKHDLSKGGWKAA